MNSSYPQDPDGIYNFLNAFESRVAQPSTSYPATTPRSYYVHELMLEDEYSAPRSGFSEGSSQTTYASVFDGDNRGNAYTISTAPSADGHERDFHQHPYQVPARSTLPCEFGQFQQQCAATFDIDDEEGWIAHIAGAHLNYSFPTRSVCWFCSSKYFARSNSYEEKEECFRNRMHHIARHWRRRERTWDDIRPDFHFIEHILHLGIIGEDEYNYLRQHSEVQQFSTFRPAGFRQPRREQSVPEVARSRHGRHKKSKKDRTAQMYHQ